MRICLVRIDKMGDMILTLPIIQALNRDKNEIDVICSQSNFKICNKLNIINKIYLLQKNFSKILNTIIKIRKENYDYFFTFSPGILSILISIFSGSKTKSLLILKSRYKNSFSSKMLEKILGNFFYDYYLIVDRRLRFSKKNSIHQTELMKELVIKSGLKINDTDEIKELFHLKRLDYNLKKLCLIHLSSKWINKYFTENKFIGLLEKLKNSKINIVMTTDETSKNVFKEIFKKYEIINNNQFKNLKEINKIIILDKLNFDNWVSIINSSTLVITPESGCTHISSLSDNKLCVIYDADNLPEMISSEYTPWKKSYTKLFSNDLNLIEKIVSFTD